MPGAVIVADQPSGAGAGVAGKARNDLWLDQDIHLSVGTSGNTTYGWEFLDKPPGSNAALSTPTLSTCVFTPDLIGTYRVRLITNGGGAGNVQTLVFRVRCNNVGVLTNRGWALPGLGESGTNENNYGNNTRGYDEVLRAIFADLLPVAGGLNVLQNGTLVAQQRSINLIGDGFQVDNNDGEGRVDITNLGGGGGDPVPPAILYAHGDSQTVGGYNAVFLNIDDPTTTDNYADNSDGGMGFNQVGKYLVTFTVRAIHNTTNPPTFSLSALNGGFAGAVPGSVVSTHGCGLTNGSVVTLTKTFIFYNDTPRQVFYIQNVSSTSASLANGASGDRFPSSATLHAYLLPEAASAGGPASQAGVEVSLVQTDIRVPTTTASAPHGFRTIYLEGLAPDYSTRTVSFFVAFRGLSSGVNATAQLCHAIEDTPVIAEVTINGNDIAMFGALSDAATIDFNTVTWIDGHEYFVRLQKTGGTDADDVFLTSAFLLINHS